MTQTKPSVVIPIYNEEKNIPKCLKSLNGYLSGRFSDYEIVCVNDGSTDHSCETLISLSKDMPKLKVVGYDVNKGKGCAVRTGVCASDGDIVIYTDCDLAYGVDFFEGMMEGLCENDIVIGSRNLTKDGHREYNFLRKVASKAYIKLLNLAAGFDHSDSQCGIKCYKGDVARKVFSNCKTDGFAFDLEALMIAKKAGFRVGEYPVTIINHSREGSKVRIFRDTFKMLSDIRKIKKYVKSLDEITDLTKEK